MTQPHAKPVLLVEDDPSLQEVLQLVLESEGFEVYVACDGTEALKMLRTVPRAPGVIFTDLLMPTMGGEEFCSARATLPEVLSIPVVVMSGADTAPPWIESTPNVFYLRKPVPLDVFVEMATRYCS